MVMVECIFEAISELLQLNSLSMVVYFAFVVL